jgi:hypothetical protein
MALVVKDRVKETATTTGTGAVTLGGAVTGFESFSSALANSDTTYYAISHRNADEWEVGLGTYNAGVLTRTTILESSNSDSAVSFTAGTKDVFITLPADKAVYLDANDALSTGNIVTTGYIRGPASFTIDPAAHGDNTGTLIVAGNLQVDGTTTTVNSSNLSVADLNITVAEGAANAGAANGAGLTVDGANATFTYDSSNDRWAMNKSLATNLVGNVTGTVSTLSNHDTGDLAEGTNLYYTQARFNSAFTAKSSSDLSEGTNLYYTDARFNTAFSAKNTGNLSEGSNLYYTQARFNSAFTAKSSSDLSEGSNLYYTSARANADFDTRLATKTTANLAEGSNLYYTQARFNSAFTAKSSSDLSEGTNLYYTTARANSAIDARVTQSFVNALNVDAETLDGDNKATLLATAESNALALSIALG